MITGSCHCGAVTFDLPGAPAEVTDCNCSICRRYGVLWSYWSPREVTLRRAAGIVTQTYGWSERKLLFHRCPSCGCVSHWSAVDPARDRMGVNARLLPLDVLVAARIRHLDGAGTEEYVD